MFYDDPGPWLPIEELLDGALYRVDCRNAMCGVWRAEQKAFEVPRKKLGAFRLDLEYHWDQDYFPTAKPRVALDEGEIPTDKTDLLLFLVPIHKRLLEEYRDAFEARHKR